MDSPGPLTCIKCGQGMEPGPSAAGTASSSPLTGLLFYTRGQPDSGVFRPTPQYADYEHLVIGVCDRCLIAAGDRGSVLHGILSAPVGTPLPGTWSYTSWRLIPPSGRRLRVLPPFGDDEDGEHGQQ